jgi:site-specific recombinase XerD
VDLGALGRDTIIQVFKLIQSYELDCHANYSPQTYTWFTRRLTVFRRWLEDEEPTTLKDFTRENVKAFIAHLQDKASRFEDHPLRPTEKGGLSSHTIAGDARALKCFANWLGQERYTDGNVLDDFKVPKTAKTSQNILTEEEIDKLFSAIDINPALGSRDHAILWTFLDCGLRCSELINLRLNDAHIEEGYLKVFGKGRKERLVPIGVAAQKALVRYREHFRPFFAQLPVETLFVSVVSQSLTVSAVENMIKWLGKRAGVPRLHPHLLRHTFATNYLIHQCGDVLRLQQILGHASLEMVRHYAEAAAIHRDILQKRSSPMDIYASSRGKRNLRNRIPPQAKILKTTGMALHVEKLRKLKAG